MTSDPDFRDRLIAALADALRGVDALEASAEALQRDIRAQREALRALQAEVREEGTR